MVLDEWKAELEIEKQTYHNWQHLFYVILIALPFTLWGSGYVFTDLRDALLFTALASVVYEIYCLRCNVMYYGELWRRSRRFTP